MKKTNKCNISPSYKRKNSKALKILNIFPVGAVKVLDNTSLFAWCSAINKVRLVGNKTTIKNDSC